MGDSGGVVSECKYRESERGDDGHDERREDHPQQGWGAGAGQAIGQRQPSLPVAFQLYLPETWAADAERRARAGVPDNVVFQTKPAIALDQIRAAMTAGLPPGVVLMDAGYGNDTALREGVSALGLTYVAGVQSSLTVWPPGVEPLPPKPWSGKKRPPKLLRRAPGHEPVSVKALAEGLAPEAWRSVTWREGTNAPLTSRFAAVRAPAAHRDTERAERRPEEWLLIEWPEGEERPAKYWLSRDCQKFCVRAVVIRPN